jgi:HD-GYP domain-containing protein (c-di-GMP phosphodiesterase class II)
MSVVGILTTAMDVCDPALAGHSSRVAAYAAVMANRLDWDERQLAALERGATLHDVGKVRMRPELLAKQGALSRAELAEIRAHPIEGLWLVAGIRSLGDVMPYVLFHHERWDGHGYPTRRVGMDIPIEGRLLAVADAFDAMISDRPYRSALSIEQAVTEIEACAGTQFDPDLTQAFLQALEAGDVELPSPVLATTAG